MNTNKILPGILLLFISMNCYCQTNKNAFSATIGVTKDGYGAMISYNCFNHKNNSLAVSLLVTDASYTLQENKITYKDFIIGLGYCTPLYFAKDGKIGVLFNIGGLAGYEIADTKIDLKINESKMIYGAYVGLDFEYNVNDSTRFLVKINETYRINSELGKFVPFIGIGLKRNIN